MIDALWLLFSDKFWKEAWKHKQKLDNYFTLVSKSRIPGRTKFRRGISELNFTKMRVIVALMNILPYALKGIFHESLSDDKIVDAFLKWKRYYHDAQADEWTEDSIDKFVDVTADKYVL